MERTASSLSISLTDPACGSGVDRSGMVGAFARRRRQRVSARRACQWAANVSAGLPQENRIVSEPAASTPCDGPAKMSEPASAPPPERSRILIPDLRDVIPGLRLVDVAQASPRVHRSRG